MIDGLINALGYTGSDPIVMYICAMAACILVLCLAYTFLDFMFNLVLSIVGRNRNIKF